MNYKTHALKTGWDDDKFENIINKEIKEQHNWGWEYHDIKISSNDQHCLLIFKKTGKLRR